MGIDTVYELLWAYMLVTDLAYMEAVAHRFRWTTEAAMVVAQKLRDSKAMTASKFKELTQHAHNPQLLRVTVRQRVRNICAVHWRCPQCYKAVRREYLWEHPWRLCAKCAKSDTAIATWRNRGAFPGC